MNAGVKLLPHLHGPNWLGVSIRDIRSVLDWFMSYISGMGNVYRCQTTTIHKGPISLTKIDFNPDMDK